MEIKLIENPKLSKTIITIECKETDEKILHIIHLIKSADAKGKKIVGIKDDETYCLEPDEILYFESVDRKTFCYTEKSVFETDLKLYELEEFAYTDFMRISKSTVVNLNRIKSIRPDFGGKILATMENSEKIYVSRQYANEFKNKLGIGGK
ncbi:MAG: LytTR family transcriptional regulator DNA-binding domain-containing protein [Clostridia bacterium]|nr:LytTR family transcriptional regulator DNA-binding domain-containing protein [Clostridia bacterium]